MQKISVHPDKLYTKSEYSKEKGITRQTLDRWIDQGKVKTMKVRGTTLIMA